MAKISVDDLKRLKLALLDVEMAQMQAGEIGAELSVKYGIGPKDRLDINTGQITQTASLEQENGNKPEQAPEEIIERE